MRSKVALVPALLLLLVAGTARSLHAQADSTVTRTKVSTETMKEPEYFTLSAGWSWPVGGPVEDNYQSGLTLAASFLTL